VPHESALAIKDEVGFFQTVRSALAKTAESGAGTSREDLDAAIRQLVSKAVASDEVVDIFRAAGLKNPDLSILSDDFLAELKGLPHRNLAIEVLKKLLGEAITRRAKTHLIEARSFREMLEKTIKEYQNRSIEAAAVIQHLIDLAKEMREANARGEKLGLTDDELAFYDALEVNDSAVKVLGDDILRTIARDLVETVRRNVTIDWTVKESVRANLRRMVKRVLKLHGYPPDKQEKAIQTVLEQAETLCEHWAA
jgi:type I restriction enzyme R subunit